MSTSPSSHQSDCTYVNTILIHNRSNVQNVKHNCKTVKLLPWMDSVRRKPWDEIPWDGYRKMRYLGVALDWDIYLHILFVLFGYLLPWFTDFYSFVLCSNLLSTSSLTSPQPFIPPLRPAVHVVFLACCTLGYDFPLLLLCCRLSFINLIFSFLPPTSLMSVLSWVSLSHRSEFRLSLPSYTDFHTPLHAPTCNNPIGWHHTNEIFHRPHTLPYTSLRGILGIRAIVFFLGGILELGG